MSDTVIKAPLVPRVFAIISEITGELAKVGIAKDRENKQQGYSFRGIDQVYNVLAPLLAKHKLVIIPQVQERVEKAVPSKSGGTNWYVTLKVNYAFVAADDGSNVMVTTYGEAMDSGDKATNKALSAAYKYAVIQAFAIPVEGTPDADDDQVAETTQEAAPQVASPTITSEQHDTFLLALKSARMSVKKALAYFEVPTLHELTQAQAKVLQGMIDDKLKDANADQAKG